MLYRRNPDHAKLFGMVFMNRKLKRIGVGFSKEALDQSDTPKRGKHPRLIRLPEVMDRVGLRRTAVYERVKAGEFPKPRSLGPRCSVWVEAEVDAWVNQVIENGLG